VHQYPCVELENISKESALLLGLLNSNEQKSVKTKFTAGDVLFGKLRPNLRKYLLATFNGVCSSEIWVLRGNNVLNEFIFMLIQTERFFRASTITSGSKMPRADWDYISNYPFAYPKYPEQQKIAAFLSAVDKKIQLLQKKKELLEQYKKGVMQKIFSREIRFKDENGQDYPDWEEKCIGDFVKERNEYPNDYYPLYSLTIEWGMIPKSERYERSFLVKEKDRAYKIMKSDDFAFNPMNLRFGALARLKETHSVIVSKYYNVFYCNKVGYSKYFEEFLTSYNMIQYYNKMATGSLIEKRRVHFLDFVKFKFKFPAIDEQIRIANFISILDAKTNTVENQIIQTQQFKKGLLQQMFV